MQDDEFILNRLRNNTLIIIVFVDTIRKFCDFSSDIIDYNSKIDVFREMLFTL